MEKWTQRELLDFHDRLTAAQTRARRIVGANPGQSASSPILRARVCAAVNLS